jgi:hypothetical protein
MRVVIDEDIPSELTARFLAPGHSVQHVEEIGLKGKRNGVLLAALSGSADVFVTGDTALGHQQDLRKFDLAVILIHPRLLVVEQIVPLIPLAIAAYPTARKHAVTTIGLPKEPRRKTRSATRKPNA